MLIQADHDIDITGEVCPMTFVRTKLRLERMQSGETLAVRLRGD
jgi:TusA-related sulfurtransferase